LISNWVALLIDTLLYIHQKCSEATSAVDGQSDAQLQAIIRGPDFADVTMMTVAHRINTIINYDYIIVLDGGKVSTT
jgi:ABC-type multidrug transport system fused ATPase/permease subunit